MSNDPLTPSSKRRPDEPGVETRRARDFLAELLARVHAWRPEWNPGQLPGDPGRALFDASARLLAQVAERLDRMAEKERRNLYTWLGVRGAGPRGARLPVVFKLAEAASTAEADGVLAVAPVQLQVEAAGASLMFETGTDVMLVRAKVVLLAGIDPAADAYYLPGEGFASLKPPPMLPSRWQVMSLAATGGATLQLDPPLGLSPGMIIDIGGVQFRITTVKDDIVGIAPPIDIVGGIARGAAASRVDVFAPFDDGTRNRQQHALYIGHDELLNLESTARIGISGAQALASGFQWQYWGKAKPVAAQAAAPSPPAPAPSGEDPSAWQPLVVGAIDSKHPDMLMLDKKTLGAIEQTVVGGLSSRWLRAFSGPLPGVAQPLSFAALQLRVGSATAPARPVLEGLANTTPLVLDSPFLPLGREPRQFDAFYLGCTEVFSKRGATVELDFRIADSSFSTLSTERSDSAANRIVAGVARDMCLHLLSFNSATGALAPLLTQDALQPPGSGASGRSPLQAMPRWRVPIWETPSLVRVAVASGRTVWIYTELTITLPFMPPIGSWMNPPGPPVAPQAPTDLEIEALVRVPSSGDGTLYALVDGELHTRPTSSTAEWTLVELTPPTRLSMISGVEGHASPDDMILAGIDRTGQLLTIDAAHTVTVVTGSKASGPQPIAMNTPSGVIVIAADLSAPGLVAARINGPTITRKSMALNPGESCAGFDFDDPKTGERIVATATSDNGSRLLWWEPFSASGATPLMDAPLPPGTGTLAGAPLRLPQHILVPGAQASVFELAMLPPGSVSGTAPVQLWVRLPGPAAPLAINDLVTFDREGRDGIAPISAAEIQADGARYLPLGTAASLSTHLPLQKTLGFRIVDALSASHVSSTASDSVISFEPPDALDGVPHILVKDTGGYTLLDVDASTLTKTASAPSTVTVTPKLPGALTTGPFDFWRPIDFGTGAEFLTVIRFEQGSGAPDVSGNTLLIDFNAPASPTQRVAHVLMRQPDGRPSAAWLDAPQWTQWPPHDVFQNYIYRIAAGTGAWSRPIGVNDSNPELTWEYANGRSWWQLPSPFTDGTHNLKTSGLVTFDVPDDIVASDWSGRTNFWIRARLVGGDYGQELLTVTATTQGTVTTQSVTRSTTGVRPPLVVSLAVSYKMNDSVFPQHVLAEDAGTVRNQSDANRTPAAAVEAFVPLAIELARLATPFTGAADTPGAPRCCDAHDSPCIAGTNELKPLPVADAAGVASPALLVGIDGVARGAPVHLLVTVGEERDFDQAAPLAVDALVGGHLEPVVADDATRALGESGIVSMAIAHAPTVTELFGHALSWIRLSPVGRADWKPSVAGAWLNAAWVDAAQTQTYEVLGSSQGEPNLILQLARPPLLRDTLELRVNEALGDEEVAALRAADRTTVLTEVDGLPGQWVRWNAVDDPADAAAGERAYAVDEASGEVRFGNGLAGMIPPIGRNNIVAFKYRRTEPLKPTEPDAPPPQVAIPAHATLNLVTPLDGVEAVVAALDSDAGAPADDAARLLRFAPAVLRHRGRAVGASDLEALALRDMPAIAQARCLGTTGALRLVVVMRGRNVEPVRAVQRELERLLLAALPPAFAAAGSGMTLDIVPPIVRKLRVRARLHVPSLDVAGAVASAARKSLLQHFDPASGGADGLGWPLGASPDAREIAAVLVDTPRLDGIDALALLEITPGGEAPWPSTLKPDELAVLPDDGLDFSYESIGAAA